MPSRNYQPEWLYKALPFVYVVSGFAVLLALRNEMAVFGGLMLISAGGAIWFMRRNRGGADQVVPGLANERSTPISKRGFVELVWRKGYDCGHPTIDAQHRALFATCNVLFDSILTNQSKREIERLLDELMGDVKRHFTTEEDLLAAGNHGAAEAHKEVHRLLLEKANTLINQYIEGKVAAGELISFVVYDVVAQHIAKDVDWFPDVKSRRSIYPGAKPSRVKHASPRRHSWLAVLLAVGVWLTLPGSGAFAQAYPARVVKMVVANPPGGPTDIMGRIMAQQLSDGLAQPVIVENRPGANGIIGISYVVKSPPDGYTLVLAASGQLAVNVSLYKKLPFDPVKDLTPVILVASAPMVLMVHPSVPARTVKELIGLLKAQPAAFSYASAGNGTTQHLTGELFKSMARVNMIHVPYKGSPPALNDLIGGQVPIAIDAVFSALSQIKGGRVRALATTGSVRSSVLSEVPTVAEAGIPGFESKAWFGVVAPQGTPQPIVERLNTVMGKALATAELKERFKEIGAEPAPGSPEQFATFIKAEIVKWGKVVRDSGMTVD